MQQGHGLRVNVEETRMATEKDRELLGKGSTYSVNTVEAHICVPQYNLLPALTGFIIWVLFP